MDMQKAGKKAIAVVLAVGVLTTAAHALPAPRTENVPIAHQVFGMPRWTYIVTLMPTVGNNGTTLSLNVFVQAASSSSKISGTMYLEKWNGSSWVRVSSWSISGTGGTVVSKTYNGTSGTEYRARVVVTVSGERAEAYSDSCTV